MTRQAQKIPENKSNPDESLATLVTANTVIPKWRNWGDHPIIVTISLVGTLLTILATAWGLPKIIRESSSEATSHEIVTKTPIELVDWYTSFDNPIEAKRQAKVLYIGKLIRVSGKPEIYSVSKSFASFKLPKAMFSIRISQIGNASLNSLEASSFTCQISELKSYIIFLDECKIDE